jgi:hypothetical protein
MRPDVKTCLRIHVTRVLPQIAKLVRAANRVIVGGLCALCHRLWLCDLPLGLQLLLPAEDRAWRIQENIYKDKTKCGGWGKSKYVRRDFEVGGWDSFRHCATVAPPGSRPINGEFSPQICDNRKSHRVIKAVNTAGLGERGNPIVVCKAGVVQSELGLTCGQPLVCSVRNVRFMTTR